MGNIMPGLLSQGRNMSYVEIATIMDTDVVIRCALTRTSCDRGMLKMQEGTGRNNRSMLLQGIVGHKTNHTNHPLQVPLKCQQIQKS